MSFLSRLTKGLATLKDFISGLSKGVLSKEGPTQQTINSNATIVGGPSAPIIGGKKHRKTPYWAPSRKPVKIKLRTRGTKGFSYAWKARLKARARTKAKTSIHITGILRTATGFLAQILGIKSFKVGLVKPINGIKRFVTRIYDIVWGKRRSKIWQANRVSGIRRKVAGKQAAISGKRRFNSALTSGVLGTKLFNKAYKLIVSGDVKGILTKYFKVNGKRSLTKILFALGLLDRVEKKR